MLICTWLRSGITALALLSCSQAIANDQSYNLRMEQERSWVLIGHRGPQAFVTDGYPVLVARDSIIAINNHEVEVAIAKGTGRGLWGNMKEAYTAKYSCRTRTFAKIGWRFRDGSFVSSLSRERSLKNVFGERVSNQLHDYLCLDLSVKLAHRPTPESSSRRNTVKPNSEAESKCIELGFTQGTDDFNQCVVMIKE